MGEECDVQYSVHSTILIVCLLPHDVLSVIAKSAGSRTLDERVFVFYIDICGRS